MESDPFLSRKIGNYEIIERVGKGGMATVYRARQLNMNRDVAIKVLSADLAGNPHMVARFEREAQVIANLEHPRILPVYDYGHEDDFLYLVMRIVEGETLYQRLMQGAVSLDEVVELVDQITSALDHAHARGVVHRDLKPTNVLLDKQGNVYLMDFGIAKLTMASQQLTATGAVMGTPSYMAPEQWRGEPVDGRTDVYALGVMLYEMVIGHVPFESETPFTLMYKHLHDTPPSPRELLPDLPENVEDVILKALAKSPDDRYQSAGELAQAFRAVVIEPSSDEPAAEPVGGTAVPVGGTAVPVGDTAAPVGDTAAPDGDIAAADGDIAAAVSEGAVSEASDAGENDAEPPPVPAPDHIAPPVSIPAPADIPAGKPPIPLPGITPPPPSALPHVRSAGDYDVPEGQPDGLLNRTASGAPAGMRHIVDRVTASDVWKQAAGAVGTSFEAAVEKAAESAPPPTPGEGSSKPKILAPGAPAVAPAYDQVRAVLVPGEPLVGVLDVRGTIEWQKWKYLLIGGLAANMLGATINLGLLATVGLVAWLFVALQAFRTWRGQIGRYFVGFTPHRVVLLPRTADGLPDMSGARAVDWSVMDRLRLTTRYMVIDVPGDNGIHFGAIVVAEGEGGLGNQYHSLPGGPITALVVQKGFEVRER